MSYNVSQQAIFVCGPESSGTRMLTQYFIAAGFDGDGGHGQRFDNLEFSIRANKIVFRRSIPHGGQWPDIEDIHQRMTQAGYQIKHLFIWRDPSFTAISQVKIGHVSNKTFALQNITKALQDTDRTYDKLDITPKTIIYEDWVQKDDLRKKICDWIGVTPPKFALYNANLKYTNDQRMSYRKEVMNELMLVAQNTRRIFREI